MRVISRRGLGAFLVLPLLLLAGCGGSGELPPGGAEAVAYWQKVLHVYPDLPAKVQEIVEGRGQYQPAPYDLPQTEVRIYGQDGEVAVAGRNIDVLITDLDDATLRQLLTWWESVPQWADELGLVPTLPFQIPETTRHVVVLGSQGRIEVSGPDGQNHQSIKVLSDEVAGRTTIGIHTFGPQGQASLDHLVNQQRNLRGPPRSEVKAGKISLPPPEDNVTVLVIGQLNSLNIDGPSDDAQQQISFANYLNRHQSPEEYRGALAGTPFEATGADLAGSGQLLETHFSETPGSDYNSSTGGTSSGSTSQAAAVPQTPSFQPTTATIPGTVPWTPPAQTGLGRSLVVPTMPPIYIPPRVTTPPVTRFR